MSINACVIVSLYGSSRDVYILLAIIWYYCEIGITNFYAEIRWTFNHVQSETHESQNSEHDQW